MTTISQINNFGYDECYKTFNQILTTFIRMLRMKVTAIEHKVLIDRFEKRIGLLRTTTSHDAVIKLAAGPMVNMAQTILVREVAEKYFTTVAVCSKDALPKDDQFMYELIDIIRGLYPGLTLSERDKIYDNLVSMLCICSRFKIVSLIA